MNVGVDTDQGDVLDAMWGAFCAASREVEADPLSVMRHAYLDGKSKAARDEKFLAGVGQHIYIGQYADDATSLSYLNARYYDGAV
jgi:hypothetical protein